LERHARLKAAPTRSQRNQQMFDLEGVCELDRFGDHGNIPRFAHYDVLQILDF